MKKIHLIWALVVFLFSTPFNSFTETLKNKKPSTTVSPFDYKKALANVDSLINEADQPITAQNALNDLKNRAKLDQQNGYYLRCIQYQINLNDKLKEEDDTTDLNWILVNDEIAKGSPAIQTFLQVEAAILLRIHFENKRWQDQKNNNDKSENPSDWTLEKLNSEINNRLDIANNFSRQITNPELYEPLIAYFNSADIDLSIEQLILIKSIEILRDIKLPNIKDYFPVPSSYVLAPYEKFITKDFSQAYDPLNEFKKLLLYQNLLKSAKSSPNTLIYLENKRLNEFRFDYTDNEEFYLKSITQLYSSNKNNPFGCIAAESIARFYQSSFPVKAIQIINEAVELHADYKNIDILNRIKEEIERPAIGLHTEKINEPGKKMLAKVDYTNLNGIYITAYKINYMDYLAKTSYNYYRSYISEEEFIGQYADSLEPFVKAYKINLPAYSDYQSHSAEVALDSLPAGTYLLLSTEKDSAYELNRVAAYGIISVAPYVLLKNNNEALLLDAKTGSAQINVPYNIYKYNGYNSNSSANEKIYSGKTDGKGRLDYGPRAKEVNYSSLFFEIGNQILYDQNYFQNYTGIAAAKGPEITVKTIIDRAIYRPGQTVYYKCIVYDNNKKKTMANEKIQIRLQDNNNVLKGEASLVTNAYGSASGSFTLPKGGFNTGHFSILVSESYNNTFYYALGFNVEEYKRPKYAAKFIKPEKGFKLYDSVSIKGEAKAFAGYAIQNAKVEYKVVRKLKNRWDYYWKIASGEDADVTIKTGTATTDKSGQFYVDFKATPNERLDKKDNPYFVFEIEATITDLNGEVKTCNYEMTMAYTDRQIAITSEHTNWIGKPLELTIECNNLQDQPLAFTGSIKIEKLIKNTEVKKDRWWETTDTTLLSDDDYQRWFPSYQKRNIVEDKVMISTKTLKDDLSKMISFGTIKEMTVGDYIATIECKDSRGETIQNTCHFSIYNNKTGAYHFPDGLVATCVNQTEFQPKDKVKFLVSSGCKNANVYVKVSSNRGTILEKIIQLNESSQLIEVPVKESDRGGIVLNAYLISDYRLYQNNADALVPYSNKELSITLSSFRDNTEPGAKEKWIVKLKGPKAEKAAMESVASMYDQSLDALYPNPDWALNPFDMYYFYSNINSSIEGKEFNVKYDNSGWTIYPPELIIPRLMLYNENNWTWEFGDANFNKVVGFSSGISSGAGMGRVSHSLANANYKLSVYDVKNSAVKAAFDIEAEKIINEETSDITRNTPTTAVNIRKNFNETVFFYPHLYANKKGEISLEFTMPEALTQWKMRMLSHSTTLQTGYLTQSITTSKKVMVQPNVPRFLREGDAITITSKIVNTTAIAIQSKVNFTLVDESTGLPLKWSTNAQEQIITVPANGNVPVSFALQIPNYTGVVTLAITASAGTYSDGEQHTIPVLSNRQLITESLPITIRKQGTQNLEFKSLKNNASTTLVHEKLTVEMSSNPAWYAVQALPYMMEFPNECAEQTFTRLYANSIGTYLANSNPAIKKVYTTWQRQAEDGKGLQSKLLLNQDLKSTVIEETPWLAEANTETERMQKLGALFNQEKMNEELQNAFEKLKQIQLGDGSFGWFAGMQGNSYITQTIVIGFGKMKKMGVDISAYEEMIENAMDYLDREAERDYKYYQSKKELLGFLPNNLQYLYCKSFFPNIGLAINDTTVQYFAENAEKTWVNNGLMNRAQLATALKTLKPSSDVPAWILKSFVETSRKTEEMGMYWTANKGGYYWHEAPIETQAAIIEFFATYGSEKESIQEQQIWLLRQKQTSHWASTRSTADACYSLLMNGGLLNNQQQVGVSINNALVKPESVDAGTGYFRQNVPKESISNNSANIQVSATTNDFAYGAIYWQYFEQMDKVPSNPQNQFTIVKQIYKIVHTETGDKKVLITDGQVQVGDLIEVSLQIRCDRNMEFVHIKDLRASGTEPVDVISEYKWQNSLGYYQVTKDASTNFFVDYMAKGIYQINYTLKVEQAGNFNMGLATAQCMYAPEYSAHSTSATLKVK